MECNEKVIVATLALLCSVFVAITQFRDRRLTKYNLERAHMDSLLGWHFDVINTLSNLRDPTIDLEMRKQCRRNLSALIDQGRFYFPNIDRNDNFGHTKPSAYRGYRHLALDFLVSAFNLSEEPSSPDFFMYINLLQQHFTSMVFNVVKPSERLDRLKNMTDKLSITQESYEQFYSDKDAEILRHLWPH